MTRLINNKNFCIMYAKSPSFLDPTKVFSVSLYVNFFGYTKRWNIGHGH